MPEHALEPVAVERNTWTRALIERVQAPRGVLIVAGVAMVLALPSLGFGLAADDHVAKFIATVRRNLDPFAAFSLQPQPGFDRSTGYLAWWSSPQLDVAFFRPLSALTHAEFLLWPNAAWAMHGVNVLCYGALVAVAFTLYRELLAAQPLVAALAAVLFAIDDGHAVAVGWISSRNTLLSALFVLASMLMHHRARTLAQGAKRRRILGALFAALAFLSGEAGISILAFLAAYELAFERAGLRQRFARLWRQLSVAALWLIAYLAGGYGARGTSLYRDLSDPLAVLASGLADLPLWLVGLLGPSVTAGSLVTPPLLTRMIAGLVCLPLLAAMVSVLPRTRESRFFALGALLCLPPLFMTVVQDRVLMLASFGGFGVLASFITHAARSKYELVRGVRWLMIAVHGVLAPLLFVPLLESSKATEYGSDAVAAAIPERAPAQVILVNAPLELLTLYAYYILREQPGREPPEVLQQLYAGASSVTATRVDETTLELRAADGWGATPLERIFSTVEQLPQLGETLELDRLSVSVHERDAEGHPTRVHFHFPSALEFPDRLWYVWNGTAPQPWHPPTLGASEALAPLSLRSLAQ